VESATDDGTQVAAALALSNALGSDQRLAEAVEVCDRVAARLEGHNTEGHLMLEAMAVAVGSIDADVAPLLRERATALMGLAGRRPLPRYALAVAADEAALANQPAGRVADLARGAIAAGPRPLPLPDDPPWFPNAVIALFYAERYVEAQTLLDAAVAEAQATANGLMIPVLLALRSWLALRRGDLTAAEADGRVLLDAAGSSSPLLFRLLAAAVVVDALVERGDLDGAERALAPMAIDLHGTSQTAAMVRHARGRLLFARRRFGEASTIFG
jgi:tetratricopeptide (TPR) repeat protein